MAVAMTPWLMFNVMLGLKLSHYGAAQGSYRHYNAPNYEEHADRAPAGVDANPHGQRNGGTVPAVSKEDDREPNGVQNEEEQ